MRPYAGDATLRLLARQLPLDVDIEQLKALIAADVMPCCGEQALQEGGETVFRDQASCPETSAVVARLLQNQVDIGNAVKPYYGKAGVDALAKLLTTHIKTAVATYLAAKSGDAASIKKAKTAFYANGRQSPVSCTRPTPGSGRCARCRR